MPLNKSKSRAAFQENVKTEIAAGKPPKQAVAIAYATQGEKKSAAKSAAKSEHHSDHSARRSEHYHQHVAGPIVPSRVLGGPLKMTRAEHQLDNQEDSTSRFSMTNRARKP